jgi:hypothetical protein
MVRFGHKSQSRNAVIFNGNYASTGWRENEQSYCQNGWHGRIEPETKPRLVSFTRQFPVFARMSLSGSQWKLSSLALSASTEFLGG